MAESGYKNSADFIDYLLRVNKGKQVDGVTLKEWMNVMREVAHELKKQGVNINQMARHIKAYPDLATATSFRFYEMVYKELDVVDMLQDIYGMDIRLKGKTISYALPYDLNKGGKTKAVRGSRLGKHFTVEGIEQYRIRMGYNEEKMQSVRYKMSIYDDFLEEYDYRKRMKGMQRTEQIQEAPKRKEYCR